MYLDIRNQNTTTFVALQKATLSLTLKYVFSWFILTFQFHLGFRNTLTHHPLSIEHRVEGEEDFDLQKRGFFN